MEYGLLLLRVVVGLLFAGHGSQKLFGWFGGGGPQGTAAFFSSIGYRVPATMAIVVGPPSSAAACSSPAASSLHSPRSCWRR